jgi:hypothetical protein
MHFGSHLHMDGMQNYEDGWNSEGRLGQIVVPGEGKVQEDKKQRSLRRNDGFDALNDNQWGYWI